MARKALHITSAEARLLSQAVSVKTYGLKKLASVDVIERYSKGTRSLGTAAIVFGLPCMMAA